MKTGEKLSDQLLCDVCIHLIELNHFWMSSVKSLFLWSLRKDIREWSLEYAEKKIPSDKNHKEAFSETALGHVISTHTVKLLFSLSSILTLSLFCEGILGSAFSLMVKTEISSDGYWREDFSVAAL